MAEVQDRHRKAAAEAFGADYMHDIPIGVTWDKAWSYAQALADQEAAIADSLDREAKKTTNGAEITAGLAQMVRSGEWRGE